MTARGKREAKRSASPLVTDNQNVPALKGRNSCVFRPFRPRSRVLVVNPGRRASRLPWAFIYRAVGALLPTFEAKPRMSFSGCLCKSVLDMVRDVPPHSGPERYED